MALDNWNSIYSITNDTVIMRCNYCHHSVFSKFYNINDFVCPYCKGSGKVDLCWNGTINKEEKI